MTDPIVLAAADWIHASECDCKEGPHTSHIAVAVDIISEVKPLIRQQIATEIEERKWMDFAARTAKGDQQ